MKRVLALVIFGGLLFFAVGRIWAVTLYPKFSQSKGAVVTARVGQYHLTITGFQSPYASIILKTQNGVFLASTTADSKGYFSITNLLINTSELKYCFQAVDFRRIGLSESCITIPANIDKDVTYDDVFLPPTIGLSKKQIDAGQDAIIYGFSMPGATVYLNIEGKVVNVTADNTGFYTYTYKNVPKGIFRISATATLASQESLKPTNEAVLEALSLPDIVISSIPKPGDLPPGSFNLLPFLLAGLALLTAIGILLYKLKFRLWVIFIDFLRRRKKMHHDWFLDKW